MIRSRALCNLAVLAFILVSTGVNAKTKFTAWMSFPNGKRIEITEVGPISLPSALYEAGWSCQLTPEGLSNDASQIYHNIACGIASSAAVIGASCAIGKADKDVGSMAIRTNGGAAGVEFTLFCSTEVGAKAPSVQGDDERR